MERIQYKKQVGDKGKAPEVPRNNPSRDWHKPSEDTGESKPEGGRQPSDSQKRPGRSELFAEKLHALTALANARSETERELQAATKAMAALGVTPRIKALRELATEIDAIRHSDFLNAQSRATLPGDLSEKLHSIAALVKEFKVDTLRDARRDLEILRHSTEAPIPVATERRYSTEAPMLASEERRHSTEAPILVYEDTGPTASAGNARAMMHAHLRHASASETRTPQEIFESIPGKGQVYNQLDPRGRLKDIESKALMDSIPIAGLEEDTYNSGFPNIRTAGFGTDYQSVENLDVEREKEASIFKEWNTLLDESYKTRIKKTQQFNTLKNDALEKGRVYERRMEGRPALFQRHKETRLKELRSFLAKIENAGNDLTNLQTIGTTDWFSAATSDPQKQIEAMKKDYHQEQELIAALERETTSLQATIALMKERKFDIKID